MPIGLFLIPVAIICFNSCPEIIKIFFVLLIGNLLCRQSEKKENASEYQECLFHITLKLFLVAQ